MNFYDVAQAFESIRQESSRLIITEKLADIFRHATPEEVRMICYMSLGMLRAEYQATQFNLAEKSIAKIVSNLLELDEKELKKRIHEYGDIGRVVVHADAWHVQKHLSLEAVYTALCGIEELSGEGSQELKMTELSSLLTSLDPVSAGIVIGIITGKLRLGFSDMTLIDALSWMITGDKSLRPKLEHGYNICADIGLIGYQLKKHGIEAIEKLHITVGIPILPAKAERLDSAEAIIEKIGPCVSQAKLDGFRLQIHIDNTRELPFIRFYSRNLQNMSHMFPEIYEACTHLDVETLICEGEAIAYNAETDSFVPFQETVKRKRKHGIDQMAQELPLRVFLFDVLFLNGTSMLTQTHEQRRAALKKTFSKPSR